MTSLAVTYWQISLAQGLCTGIGMSMTFMPAVAVVGTYFARKKPMVLAIAASGAGFGSVVFPAIVQYLTPQIARLLRPPHPPPSAAAYTTQINTFAREVIGSSDLESLNLLLLLLLFITNAIGIPLLGFLADRSVGPIHTLIPSALFSASCSTSGPRWAPAVGWVNLGPTYITAAYLTTSNEPALVAKVAGSVAYQVYIDDTRASTGRRIQQSEQWYIRDGTSITLAPPVNYDYNAVKAIFAAALLSIQTAAEEHLPRPVEITAVSIPKHFNATSGNCVTNAAVETLPSIIKPTQVRRLHNEARMACGLTSCEGYGLDATTCDDEDGANFGSSHWAGFQLLREPESDCPEWRCIGSDDCGVRGAVVDALPEQEGKFKEPIDPLFVGAVGAAHRARMRVLDPGLLEDDVSGF
ncbi:hypothetical protein MMC18_007969 [Xylographa bjoerkii]|nr:hypothetical protein [Xylographa bjoerkii]